MDQEKTSIKDNAKALGISITPVSFILNGKATEKRISVAMTERVEAYLKEENYKPSHVAQSLRSGKSKVIVPMVEDISNRFFPPSSETLKKGSLKKAIEMIETFKTEMLMVSSILPPSC